MTNIHDVHALGKSLPMCLFDCHLLATYGAIVLVLLILFSSMIEVNYKTYDACVCCVPQEHLLCPTHFAEVEPHLLPRGASSARVIAIIVCVCVCVCVCHTPVLYQNG